MDRWRNNCVIQVFKQWQHVGVSICLQFGPLSLAVMIWQKSQWTQTETDYSALMPDNKDCKSTRGSFQSSYDTESAKSFSDICPESIQSDQLLKGEKKCHWECWNYFLGHKNTTCLLWIPTTFNGYKLHDESNLFCIKAIQEALAFSEVMGQIR